MPLLAEAMIPWAFSEVASPKSTWSTTAAVGGRGRSNVAVVSAEARLSPARRTSAVTGTAPPTTSSGSTTGTSATAVAAGGHEHVGRRHRGPAVGQGQPTTWARTSAVPVLLTGTVTVACSLGSAPSSAAARSPISRPEVTVTQSAVVSVIVKASSPEV